MTEFKHFISLGYFCSIALELNRIGLRDCSSPFDWCISDWIGVETVIDNHFKGFLDYDKLKQSSKIHSHYKNEYEIYFYHDFNEYGSLKNQLPEVQNKYKRRIDRFYKNITEPTLFIRYISSENGREEIDYIEKNYSNIIEKLRQFNNKNDIIFIANKEIQSSLVPIYLVEKDENDDVARKPLDKCEQLKTYLTTLGDSLTEKNKKRDLKYRKHYLILNEISKIPKKLFCKEYIHDKQY